MVVPKDGVFDHRIAEAVAWANTALPEYASVKEYIVASEPFSVDNGFLTASLKTNRPKVVERFSPANKSQPQELVQETRGTTPFNQNGR